MNTIEKTIPEIERNRTENYLAEKMVSKKEVKRNRT